MRKRIPWLLTCVIAVSVPAHSETLECKSLTRHTRYDKKCESIELSRRMVLDLEHGLEICDEDSCSKYAGKFEWNPVLRTAFLTLPDGRQFFASYQPESGWLFVATPLYMGSFGILTGECPLPKS